MKTPDSISELTVTAPEALGFSADRLGRIGEVMGGFVEEGLLAGFITLVARRGKIAYFHCHGMQNIESGQVMRPDTIFRIYSMTKPITSLALMMLYEEGRFQLDEPVKKYLPAFGRLKVLKETAARGASYDDLERDVTFRHLLTHTSGMCSGLFEDSPVEDMIRATGVLDPIIVLRVPLEELVRRLAEIPLAFQPGTGWHYSLATDVIGHLISLLADTPFDQFLAERIFKPLGMTDTGFYVPTEKAGRLAAMYGPSEEGGLALVDAPETSPLLNPDYHPSGGAGLLSTTADYLRFAQMLLNGGEFEGARLLGRKTLALMTANHLPNELIPIRLGADAVPGHGFGLGFKVVVDPVRYGVLISEGSFGWAGIASTDFWVDPKEELIGLLMLQFIPSRLLPVPLRDIFKNLTYQALVD